ncbi:MULTISPECIES: hypothetical protein [Pseudomonas]|uniref:Uncharacterized protein n=1 Tax=Pseudomonas wuhanensis TaxID=2954098 RepID=A0ABY9GX37_9PSED|nr:MULTISPECIES: hypothetical protein [unclassified Pseudomonas]WLI14363.1 hypothetical protein PSH65_09670 [Pseudomonas sp. FP603]WLI20279.1 hypothetical protein PSH88_09690 [Pseudomonas sp. FP607]
MNENGLLKISYQEVGYPMELVIAAPLNTRADEYAVLFNILRHYENRKNVHIDLTVTGAEHLRPQVAALGITDVAWAFV